MMFYLFDKAVKQLFHERRFLVHLDLQNEVSKCFFLLMTPTPSQSVKLRTFNYIEQNKLVTKMHCYKPDTVFSVKIVNEKGLVTFCLGKRIS